MTLHPTFDRIQASFDRLASPATLSGIRRAKLRGGVYHYTAHRAAQLRWLGIQDGPDVIAALRRAWRSERNRCAAGHWSASANRAAGLWQAMVTERALRRVARRQSRSEAA